MKNTFLEHIVVMISHIYLLIALGLNIIEYAFKLIIMYVHSCKNDSLEFGFFTNDLGIFHNIIK